MVILIVVACTALLVSPVYAARRELNLSVGESEVFKGRNITLIAANADSFLLCMNGKRFVVEDDRNFQGVVFDVRQKSMDYARFGIIVPENGGDCENCDNRACFQSYRAGCYTDAECGDKDACTLDSCEGGECQYRVNETCEDFLPASYAAPVSIPRVPAQPQSLGVVGKAAAPASVDDGVQAYRAATLILLGFLVLLMIIAALVVKKKDYEAWRKRQKYY